MGLGAARPATWTTGQFASCSIGSSCRERVLICIEPAEQKILERICEAYQASIGLPALSAEEQQLADRVVMKQREVLAAGVTLVANGRKRLVTVNADRMSLAVEGEGEFSLQRLNLVQPQPSWTSFHLDVQFALARPKGQLGSHRRLLFEFDTLQSRLHFLLTVKVLQAQAVAGEASAEAEQRGGSPSQRGSAARRRGSRTSSATREMATAQEPIGARARRRRTTAGQEDANRGEVTSPRPDQEAAPTRTVAPSPTPATPQGPPCSRCGTAAAVCIASPCGCSMCRICALVVQGFPTPWCSGCASRVEALDALPGSRTPPGPLGRGRHDAGRESECVVCLAELAVLAFVPCGHRCVCPACAERLPMEARRRCPQCRGEADALIRIYG